MKFLDKKDQFGMKKIPDIFLVKDNKVVYCIDIVKTFKAKYSADKKMEY